MNFFDKSGDFALGSRADQSFDGPAKMQVELNPFSPTHMNQNKSLKSQKVCSEFAGDQFLF